MAPVTSVIDTHVHLWDPLTNDYPWLTGVGALNRPYRPADFVDAAHGLDVVGLVFVEAGCRSATAELTWVESIASDWPLIQAIVAQVPLEQGHRVAPRLAQLVRRPLVAGVRRNVQDERPGFMTAPGFVAGVAALAPHRLPFDACVREGQLRELAALADRCPDVTFVLDHLGKPNVRQRRRQPWFDDLAALARRPNVFAKLSGLTTEADPDHWQPADIAEYLTHALDVFGPQRCLFGSDWPVATLATSYGRWLDVVLAVITDLPDPAQARVLAGTARHVYIRG